MMPSCIRCQGRATTVLTYRHSEATAYLDVARGHEKSYHGMLLCDEHAGRFSAPVGWTTIDRRVPTTDVTRPWTIGDDSDSLGSHGGPDAD